MYFMAPSQAINCVDQPLTTARMKQDWMQLQVMESITSQMAFGYVKHQEECGCQHENTKRTKQIAIQTKKDIQEIWIISQLAAQCYLSIISSSWNFMQAKQPLTKETRQRKTRYCLNLDFQCALHICLFIAWYIQNSRFVIIHVLLPSTIVLNVRN